MNAESRHTVSSPRTHLPEIFGDRTAGYCVEVGAYDGPPEVQATFEQRGWQCLWSSRFPSW